MLSPLDAASLASCIVQFVDTTTKVVIKAKEIYETGSDLESLRLRLEARDVKILNEDLAKREKLLKVLPAEDGSDRPHAVFNPLAKSKNKEEEKLRKNRLELRAIEDRIQTNTALHAVSENDYKRHQKDLEESTKYLFRISSELKGREMQRLSEAGRLASGERVSTCLA
jgi:hypothetical protein